MRNITCLLLLCEIVFVVQPLCARPLLKCTEYKSGGAMDHSRVSCYVQDSKGILWFGTWIGLCRYDGQTFHYFLNGSDGESGAETQPLGSNRIQKMVLDSRENIWCENYDGGLYLFDRETSTFRSILPLVKGYPAGLALKDKVYVMPANHAVWSVLADGTLVRFDDRNPENNEVFPITNNKNKGARTVYEMKEDSQGREWVLTDQGVYVYGQGQITNFPYTQFLEQNGHCYLLERTTARLAEYMPDSTLRTVRLQLPATVSSFNFMQVQGDSLLSISTERGLVLYDTQTDSNRFIGATAAGKPLGNVSHAYTDSKGRMWILGGNTGVYCLLPGEDKCRLLPNPEKDLPKLNESGKLYLVTEDAFGIVWIKPHKGNLCWVNDADLTLHSYKEVMTPGTQLPIQDYDFYFVDIQQNLWVSSGTRIYHFTFGHSQFDHIPADDPMVEVRSLFADGDRFIWYGDKKGHLCQYDRTTRRTRYLQTNGQWTDRKASLCTQGVFAIHRMQDGRMLVGTRGDGLFVLTPKGAGYSVRRFCSGHGEYDLNCDVIYDLYEDEYGHVWIATFGGGLNLMRTADDGSVQFLNAGNKLLGYPVHAYDVARCVRGDGKGRIMVGTSSGLLAFSSQFNHLSEVEFHVYQAQTAQPNPLQDNMVMRVLCDSAGTFYISTYARGLSRVVGDGLDSLQFVRMSNRDFPAGDVNMSAIALQSGQVWTVAECGITCFSPDGASMQYFDEHDFDRAYAFTECKPQELSDGTLLFGLFGGIFTFRPEGLHKSSYSPQIVFTERCYSVGAEQHTQEMNDIDLLTVEPSQRSTSLHYAAVDLVPSRLFRYAYWLESSGSSAPQWVYTETPEVNFANLAPGHYRLHVRSTNSDGIWCANERILAVDVVPTFWERWSWLCWVLFFVIVAGSVFVWYMRHSHRREKEKVKQEVSAAKIEMITNPADSADQEFIRRLVEYLESHLDDSDLQVTDVADHLNMSRATFYRRLKQFVDLSPNDFIHQVRMRRAAEMLAKTDDPVSTIAYSVGFNNPKYFSKCFRHDYGVSPIEYRRRAKEQTEPSPEEPAS